MDSTDAAIPVQRGGLDTTASKRSFAPDGVSSSDGYLAKRRDLQEDTLTNILDAEWFNNHWSQLSLPNFSLQKGEFPKPGTLVEVDISSQINGTCADENVSLDATAAVNSGLGLGSGLGIPTHISSATQSSLPTTAASHGAPSSRASRPGSISDTNAAPARRSSSQTAIQTNSDGSANDNSQKISANDSMIRQDSFTVDVAPDSPDRKWRLGRIIEYQTFPHSFISNPKDSTGNETELPFKTEDNIDLQSSKVSKNIFDGVFIQLQGASPAFGMWVPLSGIRPRQVSPAEPLQPSLAEMYPRYNLYHKQDEHSAKDSSTEIEAAQVRKRTLARTGIVWAGFGHGCPCYLRKGKNGLKLNERYMHHERPERLIKIFAEWQRKELLRYVTRIPSRMATLEELQLVHIDDHLANYYYDDNDGKKLGSSEIRAAAAAAATARSARRMSAGVTSSGNPSTLKITSDVVSSVSAIRAPDSSSIAAGSITSGANLTLNESKPITAPARTEQDPVVKIAPELAMKPSTNAISSSPMTSIVKSETEERSLTPKEAFLERWNFIAHVQLSNNERDEQLPHFSSNFSCGFPGIAEDTTFNPLSSPSECRYSVGALFNLIEGLFSGRITNGFAAIRPPGHHAETDKAMGFCIYNNVALGSRYILNNYRDKVKRIAIVDWDVHHGNGTEAAFYEEDRVLYISLHKFENGQFYPFTGYPDRCGSGPGQGKNVNIAFSSLPERHDRMGDTEYISAFKHIVIPILLEYAPDMVFVSAGFDLAEGHNGDIGGYRLTPRGIALMSKMLLENVSRHLIAVLEGGYELGPLATGATACLHELIAASSGEVSSCTMEGSLASLRPNMSAVKSLSDVIAIQSKHWKCMEKLKGQIEKEGQSVLNLPSSWRIVPLADLSNKKEVNPMLPEQQEEIQKRRLSIGY